MPTHPFGRFLIVIIPAALTRAHIGSFSGRGNISACEQLAGGQFSDGNIIVTGLIGTPGGCTVHSSAMKARAYHLI